MKPLPLLLTGYLLCTLPVSAEEKGPFDLCWKIDQEAIVTYQLHPVEAEEKTRVRTLRLHGHQLVPKGPASHRVALLQELGDPLVLSLPPRGKRIGSRWRASFAFQSIREQHPFALQGHFELRGWQIHDARQLLEIVGTFNARPLPRQDRDLEKCLRRGKVETFALFDPEAGHVVSASVNSTIQLQTEEGEEVHSERWRYEFAENWIPAVDDLQPSIDEAVDRGVTAMKSAQQPNGSFGKPTHPHRQKYPMGHTSLCLLALLKSEAHNQ